jgi:hypothetical protein
MAMLTGMLAQIGEIVVSCADGQRYGDSHWQRTLYGDRC